MGLPPLKTRFPLYRSADLKRGQVHLPNLRILSGLAACNKYCQHSFCCVVCVLGACAAKLGGNHHSNLTHQSRLTIPTSSSTHLRSQNMFEKCKNCGVRLITGKRDQNGIFCSTPCRLYYANPGFCKSCDASTTTESAGSTTTINGIGTKIYGSKSPCSQCGSVIQTKFFCLIYIPVIPLGKYRIKWATPSRYISRKVKPSVQV